MMTLIDNKIYFLILFILLITVLTISFSQQVLIIIFLFFGLLFAGINNRDKIFVLIIVGYLAASNQIFPQYRSYITILLTLSLVYLFIKVFGLNFKNYPRLPKEILFFFFLLFFTLLVSSINSLSPLISFKTSIRMLIFFLISYLFYANLYKLKNVYTYIYALCIVMLILGSYMFLDLFQLGIENFFVRSVLNDKSDLLSTVGNTGITIYFITISFLTVMFFSSKFTNKVLLAFLFFLNIIFLVLANSRGGIVAAILSITFILLTLNKKIFLKYLMVIAGLAIIIVLLIPGLVDIADVYLRWHTVGDREAYWQAGIDVINDYPVFGLGPGLFANYFFSYASSSHINFFFQPGIETGSPHPHNIFLYYMSENGILGLLTTIVFFCVFFYLAFKTLNLTRKHNKEYYLLTAAITGIGIGIFFKSLIEVTGFMQYGFITTDLPFWLVYGLLLWIYQHNRTYSTIKL